jgi:hypothetical protein
MSVLKKIQFVPALPSGVASWTIAPMEGIADGAIIGVSAVECQKSVHVLNISRMAQ